MSVVVLTLVQQRPFLLSTKGRRFHELKHAWVENITKKRRVWENITRRRDGEAQFWVGYKSYASKFGVLRSRKGPTRKDAARDLGIIVKLRSSSNPSLLAGFVQSGVNLSHFIYYTHHIYHTSP
jgi:hypothetical protein